MSWLGAATYLDLGASLILFGAALFPFYARARAPTKVLRWSAVIACVSGVCTLALEAAKFGAPVAQVLQTGIGHVWAARIVLAAVIAALSFWESSSALLALLAAIGLALFGMVGHANAIAGWPGAAVEALHLLAASGWLGGLIVLFIELRKAPSPEMVQRFSRAGMVFVLVIGVTGGALLFLITGTALPMLAFDYGQFATVKIVLFGAALVLAAFNRLYAAPRHAWGLLVKNTALEGAILASVLAAAIALAATEPLA